MTGGAHLDFRAARNATEETEGFPGGASRHEFITHPQKLDVDRQARAKQARHQLALRFTRAELR
jgi:hypothetical protein